MTAFLINATEAVSSGAVGTGSSVITGPIELTRTDSIPYIDFRTGSGEDFDCRFQMNGSNGLRWYTGGNNSAAQRMELSSSGNMGIGITAASNTRLYIRKGAEYPGNFSAFDIYVQNSTPASKLLLRSSGYIYAYGIQGKSTGSAANVYVDSNGILYRSTSSIKYKTDIQNAIHGLNEVLQLRSVKYRNNFRDNNLKNNNEKIYGGLIAEEVHNLGLTEFIEYNKNNEPDSIHYGHMVSLIAKAIQELYEEFKSIKLLIDSVK